MYLLLYFLLKLEFSSERKSIFERETSSIYVVAATFDRSDLHDYRATVVGRKSTAVSNSSLGINL